LRCWRGGLWGADGAARFYAGQEIVSSLVSLVPLTHHLIILSQSKRPEERAFYLQLAVRETRPCCAPSCTSFTCKTPNRCAMRRPA